MRKLKHLWVDCDGVLADLDQAMDEMFPEHEHQRDHPKRVSSEQYFDNLVKFAEVDGFRYIRPTQHLKALCEMHSFLHKSGVPSTILTSSENFYDPMVISTHKIEWLHEHVMPYCVDHGKHFPVCIVGRASQKANFAHTGHVLIDDFKRSCDQFEAAGGKAFCFDHTNPDEARLVFEWLKENVK